MSPLQFRSWQSRYSLRNCDAAKRLGVSIPTIQKYRNGRLKIPEAIQAQTQEIAHRECQRRKEYGTKKEELESSVNAWLHQLYEDYKEGIIYAEFESSLLFNDYQLGEKNG